MLVIRRRAQVVEFAAKFRAGVACAAGAWLPPRPEVQQQVAQQPPEAGGVDGRPSDYVRQLCAHLEN